MARCPNCESSAQPKIIATEYNENGWTIEVVRIYKCGCGQAFTGTSYFHCEDCYEIVEELPKKLLTNQ